MTTTHPDSVELGDGSAWTAHHDWTDGGCVHVDGFVHIGDRTVRQLDVVATGDPDFTDEHPEPLRGRAVARWDAGGVLVLDEPVATIVVPALALDRDIVADALRRWAATG